jgi:release factor glutamine methyltransferase
MTFGEIEKVLIQFLPSYYSEGESKAILHLIVEHFTGVQRSRQRKLWQENIPADTELKILDAIVKLGTGMPVQYVLGEAWFLGQKFTVDNSVLIPRPETEELVFWAVEAIQQTGIANPSLIDIGTGSGCIAVSIAKMLPNAKVTAIDISEDALNITMTNAKQLGAAINCIPIDFLDEKEWSALGHYDLIVSNPPYIPMLERDNMEAHVADWEPSVALFTPDNDPQIFYKKIIQFSKSNGNIGAQIFLEGHQDYLSETKQIFEEAGFLTELKKDINNNKRMLKAIHKK